MYKILSSQYAPDIGASSVHIMTDLGEFSGLAKLHPEDRNYESSYTGCHIAELRARRKYWIALRKQYRAVKKELVETRTAIESLRTAEDHYKVINLITKRIEKIDKAIDELTDYINDTHRVAGMIDAMHRETVDKINQNKDKNN